MIIAITMSFIIQGIVAERCPKPTDTQSDTVKNGFKMEHFLGTYYEIGYHDYT